MVKRLDVLKNGGPCLLMSRKMLPGSAFAFERAKEPLNDGILPTLAFSTQTQLNAVIFEEGVIRLARVLTPTVRVMESPHFRFTMNHRHAQCLLHELFILCGSQSPADNAPREQIHYDSQARASH